MIRVFYIFLVILLLGTGYFMFLRSSPIASFLQKDFLATRIAGMSLEEKIGQLLIVGFEHPYLDEHIREMISRYHIGGVNLLGRNVENKAQITALIRELQALNASGTGIPLFIAADQEGGLISRFTFMRELTPQSVIATAEHAEKIAYARGKELKEIGVTMNFSPLADYVTDSTAYLWPRVFHGTPVTITTNAAAMLRGYLEASIIPVLKHFPGYGNISPDPHTSIATLRINTSTLQYNFFPFEILIKDQDVPAIMTAHIIIPSMDSRPATFSHRFLTELLRDEWEFQGVVITDDLEMGSTGLSAGDAAVAAFKAGADMMISTKTPSQQIEIFEALKDAVARGEIPEARLNKSMERILTLKKTVTDTAP